MTCDVKPDTIRYYERRGLLEEPARSPANYRIYRDETVLRVRSIKRAQRLGFTLEEIRQLLAIRESPGARCGSIRERAEAKIHDIDGRISDLRAMRDALAGLLVSCSKTALISECPILDALVAPEDDGG